MEGRALFETQRVRLEGNGEGKADNPENRV
jgi:hypothetical protein